MTTLSRNFALIPAAGKSRRMGQPKLSLPLGAHTIVERVVLAFQVARVEKILVVLGPQGQELAPLAAAAGAAVLVLPEETQDMRATIEAGLSEIEECWRPGVQDCWLLAPADHPLLDPAVIVHLIAASQEHPEASIFIPTFEGRRGHPALISWSHVQPIRALPAGEGLNAYFRRQHVVTREVAVDNRDILCDLDTPEDYQRLLELWKSKGS
jgi:molybdenum cofactor cytidylyltransferase